MRGGEGESESRQFDSGVCVLNTASGSRGSGVVDKGSGPLGHPPTHTHTHTHTHTRHSEAHTYSHTFRLACERVTLSLSYLPAVVYSSIILWDFLPRTAGSTSALSGIVATSYLWLLNIWNVASATEELHFSLHFSKWTEEGNGTPLQYSCLENPMDGGA